LLSLRTRGIDPEPLLDAIYPYCRWMFSPWAVGAAMIGMFAALVLLAVHADQVALRLPEFQAFFSLRNAGWLALSVVVAKTLHELGHALACRHFGGECHELGILLLVFLPCLYCNVSDAWMFGSRWRRIGVDVAGMFVELVLAATCTALWWFSVHGWFNSICFNLMIVCSLNTLLFNGNPLLRYDGYYLLSDWLEVPNLQQRSAAALRRMVTGPFLSAAGRRGDLLSETAGGWLAFYGLASLAYRWFASLAIAWFCYQVLKPHRLELFACLLAGVMVAALLVAPWRQGLQFARSPFAGGRLHWPRIIFAFGLLIVGGTALWNLPLPHRIRAAAFVEPAGARRVYVSVAGTLASAVPDAAQVESSQTLAQLTNLEMDLEIAKLRGERNQQETKLANLKRQQVDAPEAGSEIPTAEAALADLERRLEERLSERRRLTILAPCAGTVLPPRDRPVQAQHGELPVWSGNPLDEDNRGCFLDTGTLLCLVGNPGRLEALLLVDEDQIEFVRAGQQVQLLIDQLPNWQLQGVVLELAEIDLREVPPELIEQGELPTRHDASGKRTPLRTCYQARVSIDVEQLPLAAGATGRAKILADPLSLGRRLMRLVAGTFRFLL
jgi:putative peptide zinc metalloprotease protein